MDNQPILQRRREIGFSQSSPSVNSQVDRRHLWELSNTRFAVIGFGVALLAVGITLLVLVAIHFGQWLAWRPVADAICADDNPCTVDTWSPLTGCVSTYAGKDAECEDACIKETVGACSYADSKPVCNGTCAGLCPSGNATLDCPTLLYNTTASFMLDTGVCEYGICMYPGLIDNDIQVLLAVALMGQVAPLDNISTGDIELAKRICMNIIEPWEPRYACLDAFPVMYTLDTLPYAMCMFTFKCSRLIGSVAPMPLLASSGTNYKSGAVPRLLSEAIKLAPRKLMPKIK